MDVPLHGAVRLKAQAHLAVIHELAPLLVVAAARREPHQRDPEHPTHGRRMLQAGRLRNGPLRSSNAASVAPSATHSTSLQEKPCPSSRPPTLVLRRSSAQGAR